MNLLPGRKSRVFKHGRNRMPGPKSHRVVCRYLKIMNIKPVSIFMILPSKTVTKMHRREIAYPLLFVINVIKSNPIVLKTISHA